MKKIFLPRSADLDWAVCYSPVFFRCLSRNELKPISWDGKIKSLPIDERVIVRAPGELGSDWEALGAFCSENGHLCFYDDKLVDAKGGMKSIQLLLEATHKFLISK